MKDEVKDERFVLDHITRWGSDGYGAFIVKRGRDWWIDGHGSSRGFPSPFKTKKAAIQQFERYLDILQERHTRIANGGNA